MNDKRLTIDEGSEYVVFFDGGPSDGRTDKRVSTNGTYDDEITDFVLIDGTETQIAYLATSAKMVGDQLQVHYELDVTDSDPVEAPEDRRESTN
ncbi:oligoribonuclease [Frondihabitans australicus]|uniref:Uncharacterized protein n=1 Tax=Frondihabitans australicus TaxID=386892 RepID=A0A495IF75_9MICO|nr:oligoribonuclease [Frondihabitans australicus]RKR74653.1 hypothetical protein C8E83_1778 [Frondihabitans australicus]